MVIPERALNKANCKIARSVRPRILNLGEKIVFVNPAFRGEDPNKEALEERVFSVFKRDLQKKGILKLLPFRAHEFFIPSVANVAKEINTEDILGRKYRLPFR